MSSKRTPYQTAADLEIDRLQRKVEELTADLEIVCADRDAQVDEVVRLRDVAWKHGNRADVADYVVEKLRNIIETSRNIETARERLDAAESHDVPW